ncbi:MAG: NosD domain-containing protein, partial [Promethearchaeota archaeon]
MDNFEFLYIIAIVASLILVGIRLPQMNIQILEEQSINIEPHDHSILSYTSHDPIVITWNENFTSLGFPGDGSVTDPYMITGLNITTNGICILIRYVDAYFVISDCYLSGGVEGTGVRLSHTSLGTIQNNIISNNDNGVYLFISSNITLVNNVISKNNQDIILSSVDNTTIMNNQLTGGDYGIYSNQLFGSIIEMNSIAECDYGMYFRYSRENKIVNNDFSGNNQSVYFLDTYESEIVGNSILGIQMGIYIGASSDNTISSNIISNHTLFAILIASSSRNTVVNNTLFNNDRGLRIFSGSDNTVLGNIIVWNNLGMSIDVSEDNILRENIIAINDDDGIRISSSSFSIIENNKISGNNNYGIEIKFSGRNYLVNNTIAGNGIIGLSVLESDSNDFYGNIIADNEIVNACDNSTSNDWNITNIGNFWSDYDGTGVYNVFGSANSVDHHPSTYQSDVSPPIIPEIADIQVEVGTVGNNITWSPTDIHPLFYILYRNDTLLTLSIWTGGSIAKNIDNLSVNLYNITLVVFDSFGNFARDTVIVTVHATTSSLTNTTNSTIDGFDTLFIVEIIG